MTSGRRDELGPISDRWGTDKNTHHKYTQHYDWLFGPMRNEEVVLIELGIGGYNHSEGGKSLKMWKEYFPKGRIYGIDLEDKSACEEDRIRTFRGSQDDAPFLISVVDETGPPDIIIDDASHISPLTIRTFEIMFPKLKLGGLYAIEDLQTCYWTEFWGVDWKGSHDANCPTTAMAMIKRLCDGLNHEEFFDDAYRPSYTDRFVKGIHLWHNLCILEKGLNNEGSIVIPPKTLELQEGG